MGCLVEVNPESLPQAVTNHAMWGKTARLKALMASSVYAFTDSPMPIMSG
jgi:hypothetical protein